MSRATSSVSLSVRSFRPNRRKASSNAAVIASRSSGPKKASCRRNWCSGMVRSPPRNTRERHPEYAPADNGNHAPSIDGWRAKTSPACASCHRRMFTHRPHQPPFGPAGDSGKALGALYSPESERSSDQYCTYGLKIERMIRLSPAFESQAPVAERPTALPPANVGAYNVDDDIRHNVSRSNFSQRGSICHSGFVILW